MAMATRQTKDFPIELGRYDKIQQVFISYREFGIQGIAFSILDAIGRKKNPSYGFKYYNHAMTLKPNEYITQLSGKIKKTEQQTTIISSLRIHTNLRPNRLSESEDTSNPEENEIQFSKPILTRNGSIIVKIMAADNQDEKKRSEKEPTILSSIGMVVEEELHRVDKKNGPLNVPNYPVYTKDWSVKLDRWEYIKEIIISHDDGVHGVGFVIIDAEGLITPTQWFGGGGGDIYRIILKYNEYIVRISGTYGSVNGKEMVTSLRIYTNLWPSGYRLCGNPSVGSSTRNILSPAQTSDCIAEIYGSCTDRDLISIGTHVIETYIERREVLIPEIEKKSNFKSEEVSIPEMEKKSNPKSEEVSIPETEKKSNAKSEEVSIPETKNKSNAKSEDVSIPKTGKKSNAKSEDVSIPETEKKSNVKSEEASVPEEKKSNVKSEEVSNQKMEKKNNAKSEIVEEK